MQYPHKYSRITSPFGYRRHPVTGIYSLHTGADTVGEDQIRPFMPGVIKPTKYSTAWGNNILIDHGNGIESLSAHFDKMFFSAGDWVNESDVIGIQGSTGMSTGKHLHFGIRVNGEWVDPIKYIKERIMEEVKVARGGKVYKAYRINGETYVVLKPYEQARGGTVEWDEPTKTATVTDGNSIPVAELEQFITQYKGGK